MNDPRISTRRCYLLRHNPQGNSAYRHKGCTVQRGHGSWLVWGLMALSLTACTRSYVAIPDMTTEVVSTTGEPITNARLYLERLHWADDLVVNEAVFTTDSNGSIELREVLERENSYPLLLDIPGYYFLLCFEADGYSTVTNRLSDVSPGGTIHVMLPMNTDATITCAEVPGPFDDRDEDVTTLVREDVNVDIRGRANFRFFVEWRRE